MYKILCIGDPHIKENNKEDCDMMRDLVVRHAREIVPDEIVIMGDLTHNHQKVHLIALGDATDFIYDLAQIAPTRVLIGNHDMINNSQFMPKYHPFPAFRNDPRIKIVSERYDRILNTGKRLIYLPYIPDGRLKDALPSVPDDTLIVFAHQTIRGHSVAGRRFAESGDHWPEGAPLMVSGHIHEYQWVKANMLYVGSTMQHDFGDTSDKSISVLEIDGSTVTERRIMLAVRERKTLKMTVDQIYDWVPGESRYRIYVDGDVSKVHHFFSSSKYRDLYRKGVVMCEGELTGITVPDLDTGLLVEVHTMNYLDSLRARIEADAIKRAWFDELA